MMNSQKVEKHHFLSFWTPPGLDPGSIGVTTFYETINRPRKTFKKWLILLKVKSKIPSLPRGKAHRLSKKGHFSMVSKL
jgi:hypothetical protein